MTELIPARVPLQVPVNECYRYFSRPIDYRRLPGLAVDTFAYVQATSAYRSAAQRFMEKLLDRPSEYYAPALILMTIGHQAREVNVTWGSKPIPHLAVVGADTMGIGHGGGFVTFTVPSLHQVISHMIYFNIGFNESELFDQRCISLDLGGPVYSPDCNVYKAYILEMSLREYAQCNFPRR